MPRTAFNARFFTYFAACLAAVVLAGCGRQEGDATDGTATAPAAVVSPADLVLRGGKIATVDAALGEAEAIAINGYTITAVGNNAEIERYVGPETEVIELNGRLAIPGFIEGHGHYLGLGRAKQILDLSHVKNWEEAVGMVAAAADRAAPGDWIFGRGWHQDKWDSVPDDAVDGVPRHATLSAVSPDNPVLLTHASGHAGFVNAAALAAAGIDDRTADPAGGTIVRAADGKATGLLRETAQDLAETAVEAFDAKLTEEQRDLLFRERVQLAGQEALRHGVTSFHDAGASFDTIDFMQRLESENALPIRLYVMVRGASNEELAEKLPQYRMIA